MEIPKTEAPPRSLALRPSRRPLAWILPSVLAVAAAVFSARSFPLLFLGLLLADVVLLRLAFRLLWGFTTADPDGLRNRLGPATTVVAWSEVEEFVVVPTLFGRIVRVVRPSRRHLILAAPREGLLGRDASMDSSVAVMRALAADTGRTPGVRTLPPGVRGGWWMLLAATLVAGVMVAKPWLEPWWPTRHEATHLPRACELLAGSGRLVPNASTRDGSGDDTSESATSSCSLSGDGSDVDLDLVLQRRQDGQSGTRIATYLYTVGRPTAFADRRPVRLPGLGDDAWEAVRAEDGRTQVRLLARRHNVRVQVDYSGKLPPHEAAAETEALVRTVLLHTPDSH